MKTSLSNKLTRLDYEISLLRLLEKFTNGTVIEISVTGTFTFMLSLKQC